MNKKKNLLISFFTLIFLNGCVQSTAMLGPGLTLVTTGNVPQAGAAFVTNKAVEEETGMNTVTFVSNKIEEQNSKIKIKRDFKKLVRNNFEKTRKKLILEDQSNIFK
tara:strand:- start:1198 stop:1518 length:321 start_codon:yes stop_codon:yes gene_type:complete